jgi:mono/diheme cytochrome c family protein
VNLAAMMALGAALLLASTTAIARAESPSQLYMLNCWGCHRPNGEGIPGTAPPLQGAADFLKVKGGRQYLIEVPGVSQSALNDEQVAEVMNWILQSFSKGKLPADFKPYTADEVKQLRAVRMLEITKTRDALIAEMVAAKIRPASKP